MSTPDLQLGLLAARTPAAPEGIDLRCCSADLLLDELAGTEGADLWSIDGPWNAYTGEGSCGHRGSGKAQPEAHYPTLSYSHIGAHARQAARLTKPGARLVWWYTWPLAAEIAEHVTLVPWRYKTAGAWHKVDHHGPGFHWAGCSEPVAIYSVQGPQWRDTSIPLRNAYASKPGMHSEKPVEWLEQMVRRWVPPGGLVCELYAGLGTMARAVKRAGEGRRYIGCEIDPERHAAGVALLAQERAG